MEQEDFLPNVSHSSFEVDMPYIVVSCPTCDSNYGKVSIYRQDIVEDEDSTSTEMTLIFEQNRQATNST